MTSIIRQSDSSTFQAIKEATAQGGALQGSVLWWDLYDSEVEAGAFTSKWCGAGLDKDLLPEVPPPARALRDAGQETLKGYGNKKGEYLLRPAGERGGSYYYALVNENRPTEGLVTHKQDATFCVGPSGALTVTVNNPSCSAVAKAIEAAYHRIHGTFQSRDIREAVLRALKACAGIPLRSHGGIYWVPAPFQGEVEKIATVIEATGQSSFSILPIHATAIGTKAVTAAARQSLEEQMKELKVELDGWSMDVAHGEGPRPSTVNRRIEDFADLRSKAQLYRDILNMQVGDIESKLAAAEQQAAKILLGISS
jgi:hypothetical protein